MSTVNSGQAGAGEELLVPNGLVSHPDTPAEATKSTTTPREASDASEADASAILQSLRRRWLPGLVLGLLAGASAALITWYVVPPRYTASALLQVDASRPAILFNVQEGGGNFASYQRSQITLLKSRAVLMAALSRPGISELAVVKNQPDPVAWLEKEVKGDFSLAPEVMRITITSPTPDDLAVVVNAIRDAYLNEIVEKERNERRVRLETLKKLYADYEAQLRDKRQALRELAETVGSGDTQTLAHKHRFALERLNLSQKELLQLQSDLRKAQVEAAGLPTREQLIERMEFPESLLEEAIQRDPVVLQQLAEIARLEAAYERGRQGFVLGEQEPLLDRYRAPVEAARQALASRKEQLRPMLIRQLRDKARQELSLTAADLQNRIELLENLEKKLVADIEQLQQDTRNLNKGSIDLESMREEIAHTDNVAKRAGSQIEALKVELQAPARVSVIEDGIVSDADSQKKRLLVTGGAGVGLFAVVACGLVWLDMRNRRLGSLKEVKQGLGLRLLGVIPALPGSRKGWLAGRLGGRSTEPGQLLDAVDATRTVVLSATVPKRMRCVMITSAVSGEAKTTFSVHLAASLARVGYRTLLIDGDMRRPCVHVHLGLNRSPGLSEVLREEIALADAVQPTPMNDLWVLDAGHADGASLQALAREKGKDLFATLRNQYDFVILDSAPLLPVADTLLLSRHADGVILSLLRDTSRIPLTVSAYERLSMLGVRVLGSVANGFSGDHYGPSYYYYSSQKPGETQGTTGTGSTPPTAGE